MGQINYQCLRGKVHAVAPAAPPTNPHLWVILQANGQQWFATINVRSDKEALGEPVGKSYLYYLIDSDFNHPVVSSMLARPEGLSAVERSFAGGRAGFSASGPVRSDGHARSSSRGSRPRRPRPAAHGGS
jgi:hypothetical protein